MFESALIESSGVNSQRTSVWTAGLSFTVEALLLGMAVLVPLLYTEALPKPASNVTEVSSPPPTATPRSPSVVSHTTMRSELNDGQVLMPSMIPRRIQEIHDEAEANSTNPDDFTEVIGAPPNTTGDRTIANLLHNLPVTVPKSVTPHNVRVSSGVAQGLLIREVRPQYPALARSALIQGAVVLQATIGKDGSIQNLHMLSGHPLLIQAAMDAVRQWRYRPYLLNQEPVDVDTTIQVNFTLNGAN
jgi:protein TonB